LFDIVSIIYEIDIDGTEYELDDDDDDDDGANLLGNLKTKGVE
jgi:hypothetical protein